MAARGPTQRQIQLLITAQNKAREALDSLRNNFRSLSASMAQAQKDAERMSRSVSRLQGSMASIGRQSQAVRSMSADFRTANREAGQLSVSIDHIGSLLRTFLVATGIDRLIQSADAYRRVLAKVAIHIEDVNTQQAALNKLTQIATDSWVKIDDAAFAFTRFAQALKPLGITFEELLRYIKFLNQAVALSGSTSKEAHGALLQFSQAISNNFRTAGQELNSVIEQAPALADMIARGISKITGQEGLTGAHLKKLAEEGVLTSKLVVDAMAAMFDEAQERFDRMPKTVEASLTQLYNSVVQFVGEVDRQFKFVDGINSMLETLRLNLSTIADIFAILAITMIPRLTVALVGMITTLLTVTSAVNPWMRLATVVAAIVGVVVQLAEKFGYLIGLNTTVVDTIRRMWEDYRDSWNASWELMGARFQMIVESIAQGFRGLIETAKGLINLDWGQISAGFQSIFAGPSAEALERERRALERVIELSGKEKSLVQSYRDAQRDAAIENTERANRAVAKAMAAERALAQPMGKKIELPGREKAGGGGRSEADEFARSVESLVNKMLPAVARQREYNEALGIYGKLLGMSNERLAAFGLSQEKLPGLLDAINEKLGEQATFLNTTLRQLDEQLSLARMGNLEREVESKLLDWINEARKQGEPLSQREIQLLRDKLVLVEQTTRQIEFERSLLEDLNEELFVNERVLGLVGTARERALFLAKAENDALRQGITDQAKLQEILAKAAELWDKNREAIERNKTMTHGVASALDEYLVAARDRFAQGQELMRTALQQTEDALVRFAETGKLSFEELTRSMLASITKMMANRLTGEFFSLLMGTPGQPGQPAGQIGGLVGSIGNFLAGFFHGGGTVERGKASVPVPGSLFAAAPRYHRGGIAGLAPDEVPAVLRRGEVVLTNPQYRAMLDRAERSGPAISVQMTVNTPDAASFRRSQGQIMADLGAQIQRATRRYR